VTPEQLIDAEEKRREAVLTLEMAAIYFRDGAPPHLNDAFAVKLSKAISTVFANMTHATMPRRQHPEVERHRLDITDNRSIADRNQ
jgi:hypothetical protein